MDYFMDALTTFLYLDRGSSIAVYGELSDFSKNTFICVPKTNKVLTSLEQHEGE